MPKGRPRKFDTDKAVEQAMLVFWKKGYEGTSIDDLTEAMGISRPSLYAAFGNKEGIFKRSLDHYRNDPASYVNRALEKPTAREAFAALLEGVISLVTDPERPGGCLFVCGALAASESSESIRDEVASRRIAGENDILSRFRRAAAEGDLPPDADPTTLAKLAATLLWGLSVQAVNGATPDELRRVAQIAINAFPVKQ